MNDKIHVWGFEDGRVEVHAEFNFLVDSEAFAMALKLANGIGHIQIQNEKIGLMTNYSREGNEFVMTKVEPIEA